ncbi:recombination mediator RecR [Candidatus Saccharibacteria bacterium]|nr:recombination mediator RecR [Candidatus Saccharibacteria bacterium]
MTQLIPEALRETIEDLGRLPGVGARTAERYGCFLLKSSPDISRKLSESLKDLHKKVKFCPKTFALIDADAEVSPIYEDETRDRGLVMIVEEPLDIIAIENTRNFSGMYHVLGGAISPLDGITPDELHIRELLDRIRDDGIKEIIIATGASIEGESTAIFLTNYIKEEFKEASPKITRLARGLPIGADLGYTDSMTLTHALEGRQTL